MAIILTVACTCDRCGEKHTPFDCDESKGYNIAVGWMRVMMDQNLGEGDRANDIKFICANCAVLQKLFFEGV